MLNRLILSCAALSLLASPIIAKKAPSVLDLKSSITDSSIVYPESFESDSHRLLEGWYMKNYTSLDPDQPDPGNPDVSDEEIQGRLANLPTVIEMPFNQIVRSYIDRYTEKARPQVSAILGLSAYYMPIFEQALEERGLPLELKYLPVIESALDPNAVSRHGAAGLWQFMLATAKGMGLEVSSLVDERRDPYSSSEAAANYLKSLHDTYSDWNLAIAAYNCGPNTVNKAIRRARGEDAAAKKDFWAIYDYLPAETRGYVPMFIAANYVMNYYPEHKISPVLPTKPLITDTIHINDRLHFNQVSKVLDIPVEELRLLNPQYRADVIPGSAEKSYTLVLPSRQVQAFILSKDEILAYDADKYVRRETAEPGDEAPESVEPEIVVAQFMTAEKPEDAVNSAEADAILASSKTTSNSSATKTTPATSAGGSRSIVHKVVKGESLYTIASKYGVTASEIRSWNHLRRNAVRPGQQLKIQTSGSRPQQEVAATSTSAPQKSTQTKSSSRKNTQKAAPAKPKTTNHTVKSGESLTSISKKYGVSIADLKAANGMSSDALRAGKTIKIPASGTAKKSKSTSKKKSSRKKSSKKKR